MGRSPCCDKIGLKKGPWTPEEDQKLLAYIEEHGHGSWRALPTKAGLQRCGKSCRLRWTNYLRPDIKRGKFSMQEEQTIIQLHALLGNRWSAIATHLAKRTDNEIKNYWNTHLKKRLAKMGIDPVTHKPRNDALLSNLVDGAGGQSKSAANLSHMAQWESARLEAEARLVRQSNLRTTLSFQTQPQQSAEFASTSSQIHKPAAGPELYLDVLKSWSGGGGGGGGVWSETTAAAAAAAGGELESPTSTLSSATGNGNSIPPPVQETAAFQTSGSFAEKFTDLLLSSGGDRQISEEDGGESDNSGGVDGGGGDYYEDNKNYWNSILNLVNSSPSDDSPIF